MHPQPYGNPMTQPQPYGHPIPMQQQQPYGAPMQQPYGAPMQQPYGAPMQQPGLRLFSHLDGRGSVRDGVLAWTEFAPLCQQIGWDVNVAQMLWYQTDTDRSGTLDRNEFLRFASRPDVAPYLVPLENKICGAYVQQPMAQPMGQPQYGANPMMQPMPMAQPVVVGQPTVVVAGGHGMHKGNKVRCFKCNGTGYKYVDPIKQIKKAFKLKNLLGNKPKKRCKKCNGTGYSYH